MTIEKRHELKLPVSLLEALREQARKDNRTLNGYIRQRLQELAEERK